MTRKTKWSKEWPTRPGIYWFYGSILGRLPVLCVVEVSSFSEVLFISSIPTLAPDLIFTEESSEVKGVWTKAPLPELPKEFSNDQTENKE